VARPRGQPSVIDSIVGHTAQGVPITAAERILDAMRAGNYLETAAHSCKITKQSIFEWLGVGAQAHAMLHRGEKLTAHQKRCKDFSDSVMEAMGIAEATDVARLAQLARGGQEITTTTTRTLTDGTTETTVRKEWTQPDAKVLMWRLERRFGDRWGRQRIEIGPVTPTELAGIEDVKRLRDELAQRRGITAG